MKKLLLLTTILITTYVSAAPFVTSDATTQKVTHCGVLLDSGAKVEVPVVSVSATSAICKYDVGGVAVGPHTIKTTFINIDPVWGRNESAYSVPLNFERPGVDTVTPPSGLGISK
jgi:hypothetical protein